MAFFLYSTKARVQIYSWLLRSFKSLFNLLQQISEPDGCGSRMYKHMAEMVTNILLEVYNDSLQKYISQGY